MSGGPFVKRPLRAKLKVPSMAQALRDLERLRFNEAKQRVFRLNALSVWTPEEIEALRRGHPLMPIVGHAS